MRNVKPFVTALLAAGAVLAGQYEVDEARLHNNCIWGATYRWEHGGHTPQWYMGHGKNLNDQIYKLEDLDNIWLTYSNGSRSGEGPVYSGLMLVWDKEDVERTV